MNIDGHIESKLKQLRLTGMLETLSVRLKEAEVSNAGYLDFLMTLLDVILIAIITPIIWR